MPKRGANKMRGAGLTLEHPRNLTGMELLMEELGRKSSTLVREQLSAVDFARQWLGHDPWEPTPIQVMEALSKPNASVAVKACHASSKTFTAAEVLLWFVRELGGIVVSTAPTYTQVTRLLWGEVKTAYKRALIPIGGEMLDKAAELRFTENNYAFGLSTNEGVRMQGFHGNKLLFILDEAPGVMPEIHEAIEGARAGGDVRVLMIGNPVNTGGPFYRAFNQDRRLWQTFTIDAFDTPNLHGLTEEQIGRMEGDEPELALTVRPYLITRQWVWAAYQRWGPNSGAYKSRVRGQFPGMGEDQLISGDWLELIPKRLPIIGGEPHWEAGVDVAAEGGDETVVTVRNGSHIFEQGYWATEDTRGPVVAFLRPYKTRAEAMGSKLVVKVDVAGLGYYFVQHLRDQGFDVVAVKPQQKPRDPERFADAKAEMHWHFREQCESGGLSGPISDKAFAQLTQITWKLDSRGRIVIESKDDMKKRGLDSPDRAESMMLAFYRPGTMIPGKRLFGAQGGRVKRAAVPMV